MRIALVTLLSFALFNAASAKSRDPIRIAMGQDAGQKVVAQIVARALKRSGFKSEFVDLPVTGMVDAIRDGAIHAHPAAFFAKHPALAQSIEDREVRSLGGLANNRKQDEVLKLVWPGMKKKWPNAQKMLKRMIVLDADVAEMSEAVEAGEAPEAVAKAWWKANPKSWKPWIAASKNWMKP